MWRLPAEGSREYGHNSQGGFNSTSSFSFLSLSRPTCPNFAADPRVSELEFGAVAFLFAGFAPECAPEETIRPEAIFISKLIQSKKA